MDAERGVAGEVATSAGRIRNGERLPTVAAPRVGGGELILPDDVAGGWTAVLLYRGHWCPYCRRQLESFQRHRERFEEADVRVVALSADPEAEAEATVEEHGLDYPVGFGLDPARMRETLGAYVDEEDGYVQATGFVLRPGGTVALAVYSSGAVGRLVAEDALGLVAYARERGGAET